MRWCVFLCRELYPYSIFVLLDYRKIGLDPGQVKIAKTAEVLVTGDIAETEYSLGRHRNDSGILRSQRIANKRNANETMQSFHEAASSVSNKTVVQSRLTTRRNLFQQLDEEGRSLYDRIWEEKGLPRYRNGLFRVYRATQKAIAKYVSSLRQKGQAPVIILFGDGKFGHNKGNGPAPNVRFRKECERQHNVIIVTEWMTSQTCPRCNSRFPKTMNDDDGVPWFRRYVRGLLFCTSEDCKCAPYQDRDLVGATNILTVGTTTEEDLS